ncbi:hypothetical protein BDV93DRAFT_610950 [Ceratobasidium sp. AG-I]|nr:hypothetical protein BDV93DRAFT_610950 [Ceratobasidium sp. AG-I]
MRPSSAAASYETALSSTIDVLPPEILGYIFSISKKRCHREAIGTFASYPDGFSEVSDYWRRIAISTPDLWTHIDISVGGYKSHRHKSAMLYRARSGRLPIHVHIHESEDDCEHPTSDSEINQLTHILAPCLPRIGTLEIESESLSKRLIESILDFWMDGGALGPTTTLSVSRPVGSMAIGPDHESMSAYQAKSPGRFEDVLRQLRVLRLQNTAFPWDSAAYRNLIELEYDSSMVQPLSIPISTLATILSSSPELDLLKLAHLTIIESGNWNASTVVRLDALQVLNLVDLKPQSLRLILPLITLPKHSTSLSVGINYGSGYELYEPVHAFLAHSAITTLYLSATNILDTTDLLPALFSWMPKLERLALEQYAIIEYVLPGPVSDDSNSTKLDAPHTSLRELFLIQCTVLTEALVSLALLDWAQVLHLECCTVDLELSCHRGARKAGRTRRLLRRMFPDLECIVSHADTTDRWPCRTIFGCPLAREGCPV